MFQHISFVFLFYVGGDLGLGRLLSQDLNPGLTPEPELYLCSLRMASDSDVCRNILVKRAH